jgi:hypothetical protein
MLDQSLSTADEELARWLAWTNAKRTAEGLGPLDEVSPEYIRHAEEVRRIERKHRAWLAESTGTTHEEVLARRMGGDY